MHMILIGVCLYLINFGGNEEMIPRILAIKTLCCGILNSGIMTLVKFALSRKLKLMLHLAQF